MEHRVFLRIFVIRPAAAAMFVVLAACAGDQWPDPPTVDPAQYQKEYAAWRAERQQVIAETLPIVGIWELAEGETTFGSDAALPVVLPAADSPPRAGSLRRAAFDVTVLPEKGTTLRTADGTPIAGPTPFDWEHAVAVGSVHLQLTGAPDGRLWVMAFDSDHPAVANPPAAQTYPLDSRWRVAARFEAFDVPRAVRVADVRGGFVEFDAAGELVFRVDGEEARLTAFAVPEDDAFFVMFKDPTNRSETYAGYRIMRPAKVADGEWTVLDFNMALNPPCAFSRYTVCPTPPRENTLKIAIEAGEKRLPSTEGYVPAS